MWPEQPETQEWFSGLLIWFQNLHFSVRQDSTIHGFTIFDDSLIRHMDISKNRVPMDGL